MSEIDINIEKATSELSILSDDIEIELYSYNKSTEVKPEDICIEISGLTTINGFIGLSDTPLYYEDGKFFKVVGNKIEYTDINFEDIKGSIPEDSELYSIISGFVDDRIKELSETVIDDKIHNHNISTDSHKDIRDSIQEVNDTLNAKIELNKLELNQVISENSSNISSLQEDTQEIKTSIEDLTLAVQVDIREDINQNRKDIDKNSEDILNNYTELKEESKIIDVKVNKNTEDIKNILPLWYSMEDLLN